MIPAIQFYELFKRQCPSINYCNKIVKKIMDGEDRLEAFLLTTYSNIFPGIKQLGNYCDFNICYYGRECNAHAITLYDWTDYYIVYEYYSDGDDCDVLSISHNYENTINFFDTCFKVYNKKDFNTNIFLNKIDEITFCIDVFNSVHREKGYKYFSKFMKSKYTSRITD